MKIILCAVFAFICSAYATLLIPVPDSPGFWGRTSATLPFGLPSEDSSPARKASNLRLGFLWCEPVEDVDLKIAGFSAEWGNKNYRLASLFISAALDSIYRSELFGLEGAFSYSLFTFGLAGSLNVQYVPGDDSWWSPKGKAGIVMDLPWNFAASALGELSSEDPFLSGWGVSWASDSLFVGFAEVFLDEKAHNRFCFGERVILGNFSIQNSFEFPGPAISLGILLRIGAFGGGFGMENIKNFTESNAGTLIWTREISKF
ncbi:MAG: hypothetical protein WCR04_10265 [Fibrobacteraceae bacterium]